MAAETYPYDWYSITRRRAEVLRELASGCSLPQVATRLGLSYNGARSHVESLKALTGCEDVAGLGRFWREHRLEWVQWHLHAAGVEASEAQLLL